MPGGTASTVSPVNRFGDSEMDTMANSHSRDLDSLAKPLASMNYRGVSLAYPIPEPYIRRLLGVPHA